MICIMICVFCANTNVFFIIDVNAIKVYNRKHKSFGEERKKENEKSGI